MKKNTFLVMGAAALALTLGLVLAGCDSPLQEGGTVHVAQESGPAVASVSAVQTTDNSNIIVTFNAVEGVSRYELFIQQEGKKTTLNGTTPDWQATYAVATGAPTANTDIDKYAALVVVGTALPITTAGTKYRFGIQATDLSYNQGSIVWSDYVTLR